MEVTQTEQAAVMASLPPAQRAALTLNSSQTERDLRELATKHASIQAIKDKAGRDQAHGAAMEVKRARTAIERVGKEARDDATKFSKAVIAEQNRLIDIIITEEQRLLALRDAWDTEQEKIREAAAAAERFRVEQIQGRIDAIKGFEGMARNCRTSGAAQRLADALEKVDLTGLQEFEDQALHIYGEVKGAVNQILTQLQADEAERARIKAAQEAEAARLAAERAELERQRIEAAAKANAEADRLAKERAALEAARVEFERQRAAHEARERAEQQAKEEAAAEAAKQAELAALSAKVAIKSAQEVAESGQKAAEVKAILIDEDGEVPLIADLSATPEFIEDKVVSSMANGLKVTIAPNGIRFVQQTQPAPQQEEKSDAPNAIELILTIAEQYGIDKTTARDWLVQRAADIAATEF